MKAMTLRLNEVDYERLRTLAYVQDRAVTDVVREALRDYMERQASDDEFRASLERAMRENAQLIAELAKRYLNVDTLLPTPTPAATSTAAPPPGCVDGLTFVSHPDGTGSADNPIQAGPGQRFTKVWKVKNTGTCTWDSNYELVFSSGATMGGQRRRRGRA